MLRTLMQALRPGPGPNVHWINRDLAVGCPLTDDDWLSLGMRGVRGVVDVSDGAGDLGPVVRGQGMRYLRLPVAADRLPETSELHIVTSWVLQRVREEGPVLLHESGSRGNNALVACAALIKRGESVFRASRQVKRAHGRRLTESQLHLLEHFAWQTGAGPDSV